MVLSRCQVVLLGLTEGLSFGLIFFSLFSVPTRTVQPSLERRPSHLYLPEVAFQRMLAMELRSLDHSLVGHHDFCPFPGPMAGL